MDVFYEGVVAGNSANASPDGTVGEFIAAPNAEFQVFEKGDAARANPLPVKISGRTATSIRTSDRSVLPDVYVVSDNYSHIFKSGTFEWERLSNDGMQKAADEARAAAQQAASEVPQRVLAEVEKAVASGDFKGEPGKDGSNVLPTEAAVAAAITKPGSAANTALSATVASEIVEPLSEKIDVEAAHASFPRSLETMRSKSVLSADFVERDYRANGVRVAASTAFAALDPAALDSGRRLKAYRAATNLMPGLPLTGGTLGVIGSGGALPTQWFTGSGGVPKDVRELTADGFTLRMGPSASSDFGSIRTPNVTPTEDLVVSFDIEITNIAVTDTVSVAVSWFNDTGGALSSTIATAYISKDGPQRVQALMPNPGGARRIQLTVSSPTPPITPDVKIGKFTLGPISQVGIGSVGQPPYFVGSLTKTTAVLAASNGDYVLVADTVNNGVVRANVTASGGTGVDITDALGGSFLVRSAYLVPAGQYIPEDVSGVAPVTFASARASSAIRALATLGIGKVLSQAGLDVAGADWRRSVQVSTTRPGLTRFDVRAGDVASGDGPTQERAEIMDHRKMPFGVDVWAAGTFRVLDYPYEAGEKYCLIHQWRYTNNAGDTSALSPDVSLVARPLPGGRFRLDFVTRADPATNNTVTPPTNSDPLNTAAAATTIRWKGDFAIGELVTVVYRVRFGQAGTGYVQLWVNGVEVFNKAVPVGYNRTQGPSFHFGAYRNPHAGRFLIDHIAESGTDSLAGRITKPLPL